MIPWVVGILSRPEWRGNLLSCVREQRADVRWLAVEVGEVEPVLEADRRVRLVKADPAQARNAALDELAGEDAPIVWFDDDDWYGPGYVAEALEQLELHPDRAWLGKNGRFVFDVESGKLFVHDRNRSRMPATQAFGGSMVFRSPVGVPRFRFTQGRCEDDQWCRDAAALGLRGWATSVLHHCYRLHPGNWSGVPVDFVLHTARELLHVGGWNEPMMNGLEPITGEVIEPDWRRATGALREWRIPEYPA